MWKINIHWRSLDFSLSLGSPPCSGGGPVELRAVWRLNAQQALTAPPHVCTSFGSYEAVMFIASRGPELDPPGPEPRGPIPILPAPRGWVSLGPGFGGTSTRFATPPRFGHTAPALLGTRTLAFVTQSSLRKEATVDKMGIFPNREKAQQEKS